MSEELAAALARIAVLEAELARVREQVGERENRISMTYGLPIIVDKTLSPDIAIFRDRDGREVGRITGLSIGGSPDAR